MKEQINKITERIDAVLNSKSYVELVKSAKPIPIDCELIKEDQKRFAEESKLRESRTNRAMFEVDQAIKSYQNNSIFWWDFIKAIEKINQDYNNNKNQ